MLMKDIEQLYKGKYGHATINKVLNNKYMPEIQPDIEDNHRVGNKRLTEDDVRLIRKLKAEGYTTKAIREAINNKASESSIRDVIRGRSYSYVK